MKRTLSLVLVLLLILTFAGCSRKENQLYGAWKTELDIVPLMQNAVDDCDELAPKVEQQIMFTCYLSFNEDSSYTLFIDKEEFETAVHTYLMAAFEPVAGEGNGNSANEDIAINVTSTTSGTYEPDFDNRKISFTVDGETLELPFSLTQNASRLTLEVSEPIGELNFSKINTWEMPED